MDKKQVINVYIVKYSPVLSIFIYFIYCDTYFKHKHLSFEQNSRIQ